MDQHGVVRRSAGGKIASKFCDEQACLDDAKLDSQSDSLRGESGERSPQKSQAMNQFVHEESPSLVRHKT